MSKSSDGVVLLSGPAKGFRFSLSRAPLYLRVCIFKDSVRALFQWDQFPREKEEVHLYKRIRLNGKSMSNDGYFVNAQYCLMKHQPNESLLRDNRKFFTWAGQQHQENFAVT